MPEASVIIPAYNAESTIARCLESVLSQEGVTLETVVVDDGSTDGTAEILACYASRYPGLRVATVPNGGPSRARNLGLSLCTGEFIAFCDSDDWLDRDCLAPAICAMQEERAGIAVFGYKNVRKESVREHGFRKRRTMTCKEFVDATILDQRVNGFACNKIFHESLIACMQFDEDVSVCEDLLLNVEIALMNPSIRVVCVPGIPYNYDLRSPSLTRSESTYFQIRDVYVRLLSAGVPQTTVNSALFLHAVKSKAFGETDINEGDLHLLGDCLRGPAPLSEKIKTAARLVLCKVGRR